MRLKSSPLAFQWSMALAHLEAVHLPDHLVEGAEAELGHQLAHLFGDEEEVVDDVLGLAGEALAQLRVLGGDAHRAGVQMALAHHDAARDDQRRGGEAELVGAEQRADDHVAAGAHAAVGLHGDAPRRRSAPASGGSRQGRSPRGAGVLDGGQREAPVPPS
jgi:hypothetical protein